MSKTPLAAPVRTLAAVLTLIGATAVQAQAQTPPAAAGASSAETHAAAAQWHHGRIMRIAPAQEIDPALPVCGGLARPLTGPVAVLRLRVGKSSRSLLLAVPEAAHWQTGEVLLIDTVGCSARLASPPGSASAPAHSASAP